MVLDLRHCNEITLTEHVNSSLGVTCNTILPKCVQRRWFLHSMCPVHTKSTNDVQFFRFGVVDALPAEMNHQLSRMVKICFTTSVCSRTSSPQLNGKKLVRFLYGNNARSQQGAGGGFSRSISLPIVNGVANDLREPRLCQPTGRQWFFEKTYSSRGIYCPLESLVRLSD